MTNVINLDTASYEQWLAFIFDHPAPSNDLTTLPLMSEPWYFEEQWQYTIDGAVAIEKLTRLFLAPEILSELYSAEQIDQGFWFIPGPYGVMWALLDDSVAWELRKACIQAIKPLVSKLLSRLQSGTACIMWWDSVFSYCAYKNKDLGTDLLVLSEIARCIVTIAHLESASAKEMARHGIQHLGKLSSSTGSGAIRALYVRTITDAGLAVT